VKCFPWPEKLIAIRDLEEQFSSKYKNTYYYGLWIQDLPHDLLWFSEERLTRDIGCAIPSWTWAFTIGPIQFKSAVFDNTEAICDSVQTSGRSTGILKVRAVRKLVEDLRGPLRCQAFSVQDLEDKDFTGRLHDDYKNGNICVSPTFLLLANQG
jgi:hypothetical protein